MECPTCGNVIEIDGLDPIRREKIENLEDGDYGFCALCTNFWTLKNGEFVHYRPSREEAEASMAKVEASVQRLKAEILSRYAN